MGPSPRRSRLVVVLAVGVVSVLSLDGCRSHGATGDAGGAGGVVGSGGASAGSGGSGGNGGDGGNGGNGGSTSGAAGRADAGAPDDAPTGDAPPTEAAAGDDGGPDLAGDVAPDVDADPCAPVADATLFVDPALGHDGAGRSGGRACPLRSLTAALRLVAASRKSDAGAATPWTLTIANVKGPVTLSADTGEIFPLHVPAAVTIDSEVETGPRSVIALSPDDQTGLSMEGAGWRLSFLDLECHGGGFFGIDNLKGDGALDHVTIAGCGHGLISSSGTVTAGPGVDAVTNSWGMKVQGGTLVLVGGRGADHTSISRNARMGVWVHSSQSPAVPGPTTLLDIRGADIAPGAPDANDVAIDDNMMGVYLDIGPEAMTARGLHASGNGWGLWLGEGPSTVKVRASWLAGNTTGAISLSQGGTFGASTYDFGADATTDPGRNVLSSSAPASAENTQAAICVTALDAPAPRILAEGNLFGAVDCAVGGTLATASTCTGGVAVAVPNLAAIDVGGCTTR